MVAHFSSRICKKFNKQQVYIRRSCCYFETSETLCVLFRRRSLGSVWWWSELSTVTTTAALGDTRSLLIALTVSAATSPGICTTIPLTDLVGHLLSLPHSLVHLSCYSLSYSISIHDLPNVHMLLFKWGFSSILGYSTFVPGIFSVLTVEMYVCGFIEEYFLNNQTYLLWS